MSATGKSRCSCTYPIPAGAELCPRCGRRSETFVREEAERWRASMRVSGSELRKSFKWRETKGLGWLRPVVYHMTKSMTDDALERGLDEQTGEMASYDWCRFREFRHCYVPHGYEDALPGDPLGPPADRGFCPLETKADQRPCPVSEAGPDSGEASFGPRHVIPHYVKEGDRLPRRITPPWIRGGRPRERPWS